IVSAGSWRESQPIPLLRLDIPRIDPSGALVAVGHHKTIARREKNPPPDSITIFNARDGRESETINMAGLPEAKRHQPAAYERWPTLDELSPSKPGAWKTDKDGNEVTVTDPARANGRLVALPHDKEPVAEDITGSHRWAATSTGDKILYLWPLDPTIVLENACNEFL